MICALVGMPYTRIGGRKAFVSVASAIALGVALAAALFDGNAASAALTLPGDASCNGVTNSIDASIILQYDAGLTGTIPCPDNADVNGDGHINSLDASIILQFDAGLISHIGPSPSPTPTRTRTPVPQQTTPTDTPVTPVPTETSAPPTATPTATGGCSLVFASFYTETDRFCGTVTQVQRLNSIPASLLFGQVNAPPGGEFAAVFMSVANFSLAPASVGSYSFRLRDDASRIFTLDYPNELTVQFNAEQHFGAHGTYDTIQPGLTDSMVVVFLVPSGASGLHVERCTTTGCDRGAPAPPAPPTGCSVVFASFYTETDQFCGTVTQVQLLNSIPASLLFGQVDPPPGSQFAAVFMSVANFSLAPAHVGSYSFRLRDDASRIFTLDYPNELTVQFNAEQHFGVHGTYDTIQPGLTDSMVFVFLVPSGASGLSAQRCPTLGCT